MAAFHGVSALIALAAAALLALGAGLAALLDRNHEPVRKLAIGTVAVFAAQAALGLLLLVQGVEPDDGLHLLYGAALVAVVPLATAFASDAPPRARSSVLAAAGLTALLVSWRLFVTG